MPFTADETAINERFSQYGKITNIKVLMNNGKSRGCAFVEFAKASEAKKALAED